METKTLNSIVGINEGNNEIWYMNGALCYCLNLLRDWKNVNSALDESRVLVTLMQHHGFYTTSPKANIIIKQFLCDPLSFKHFIDEDGMEQWLDVIQGYSPQEKLDKVALIPRSLLEVTHIKVGDLDLFTPDDAFGKLQADFISDIEEYGKLFMDLGVSHSSFSVGDIVLIGDEAHICMPAGWKKVKIIS